jgi:hypothetical protein
MALLSVRHAHARDARVSFNQSAHQYTVDGRVVLGSVSSLWRAYFEHFDAPKTARRCYTKWARAASEGNDAPDAADWTYVAHYVRLVEMGDEAAVLRAGVKHLPKNNGRGYSRLLIHLWQKGMDKDGCVEAVINLWRILGEIATARGTYVHLQCELDCNDESYDHEAVEVKQYREFRIDNAKLKPFRTEWSVFAIAGMYTVAGQIDAIYRDADGDLHMIDYKCCASPLTSDNIFGRCGVAPFDDVPDTPWGHYAVQQNIYRYIIESQYGLTIRSSRLLRIHASLRSYELIAVPDLRSNITILLKTLLLGTTKPNE